MSEQIQKNDTIDKIKEAIRSLGVEFVKVKPWNEKTFKIEISSDAFADKRRLDRYAMLNELLKEKLPEISAEFGFLFKPFTKEEWVVRNANQAAKS